MTTPAHRVIYTHGAGRLGNQIVRFLHWMAWVRENRGEVEVLNLAFWPFADFFAVWREHPGCVYPVRGGQADTLARRAMSQARVRASMAGRQRWQHLLQAAGRWLPGWQAVTLDIANDESLDLSDPAFSARVRRRATTTCCGWRITSWPLVAKWQAELRELFRPAAGFERAAKEFFAPIRQRHEVVIGVLIRQSDYRTWGNGDFYFSTAQYVVWIRQLLELFAGKRVAFVIASEEQQDRALFEGLPCFLASGTPPMGGHWFENWVELAWCDVIVTPPSTFSATAAFYGDRPLWPVVAANQTMAFEQRIEEGLVGAARHPTFSRSLK